MDGVLFDKGRTTLIQCPGAKTGRYAIPESVTGIEPGAFVNCGSLVGITIPNHVTEIGYETFVNCWRLTSLTIGNGVTSIMARAFAGCSSLRGVYFEGNAPNLDTDVFSGADKATVYYLPGTTGWGLSYSGRPTALWFLPNPVSLSTSLSFGGQTNRFGFMISWATNVPVVVEASADLAKPIWAPVGTNILTGGTCYFHDPQWADHPRRFYRVWGQ